MSDVYCVFQRAEDGECHCVRGGCTVVIRGAPDCAKCHSLCLGGRPELAERVRNYLAAATKHVMHGIPQRSEERIAEIKAICATNQCGLYNAEHEWCEHKKCGCKIGDKAPWAGEVCPMGFWQ